MADEDRTLTEIVRGSRMPRFTSYNPNPISLDEGVSEGSSIRYGDIIVIPYREMRIEGKSLVLKETSRRYRAMQVARFLLERPDIAFKIEDLRYALNFRSKGSVYPQLKQALNFIDHSEFYEAFRVKYIRDLVRYGIAKLT